MIYQTKKKKITLLKIYQKRKLEEKEEEFKFNKPKQNEQEEPKLKEDLISKLEDFDIDQNKKN